MLAKFARRFLHINQQLTEGKVALVTGTNGRYAISKDVEISKIFGNKRVVVVGFPGAFTPTCTGNHIPDFINSYDSFKEKGVEVIGLAVNDPFVLKEFGEEIGGSLSYIADGSGSLTKALDAGFDLSDKGLGYRTRRFTLLVENGTITQLNDENGGAFTDISSALTILKSL